MGKRKRRLHSPKYAKKYAAVRETYNRLRGVVKEAMSDGVITEQEAKQIETVKEQLTETIVEAAAVVEQKQESKAVEKTEKLAEKALETKPKERVKRKAATKPPKTRAVRRTRKTTKTEG